MRATDAGSPSEVLRSLTFEKRQREFEADFPQ
jgi:hypothetical protein